MRAAALNQYAAPTNPPMSHAQYDKFQQTMGGMSEPTGGYSGCAYQGVPFGTRGVTCQHNINTYTPSTTSFAGNWVGNVASGFPGPNIQTPGGLPQLFMAGGPGDDDNNPCLQSCSCENDLDCTCAGGSDSPGHNCGWASINQDCMAPVPNGMYKSLTACEKANYSGAFVSK